MELFYQLKKKKIIKKNLIDKMASPSSILSPVCTIVGGTKGIGLAMAKEWIKKQKQIRNNETRRRKKTAAANTNRHSTLERK